MASHLCYGSHFVLAIITSAQAQVPFTSNVSTDWLATYPTTATMAAATSATWAGEELELGQMSHNWTNFEGTSSPGGPNYEILPTYYNASSGYIDQWFHEHRHVFLHGPLSGDAIQSRFDVQYLDGRDRDPAGQLRIEDSWRYDGYSAHGLDIDGGKTNAAAGLVTEVGAVERLVSNSANVQGFTTTAFNIQSSFEGGCANASVRRPWRVLYYGTNVTSGSLAAVNVPNSAGDTINGQSTPSYATVTLQSSLGPSYVAWTSPGAGTININLQAWDTGMKADDGTPGFYVMTSTAGPTAPLFVGDQLDQPVL